MLNEKQYAIRSTRACTLFIVVYVESWGGIKTIDKSVELLLLSTVGPRLLFDAELQNSKK